MDGPAAMAPGSASRANSPWFPMLAKMRARAMMFSLRIQSVRVSLNWAWMRDGTRYSTEAMKDIFMEETHSRSRRNCQSMNVLNRLYCCSHWQSNAPHFQ